MPPTLSRFRLDADQSTPLYRQLAQQLVEAIEAGDWETGEALPSERVLAESINVFRITACKALDRLVALVESPDWHADGGRESATRAERGPSSVKAQTAAAGG